MAHYSTQVKIGNVVINPGALRRFLKKSNYWLDYDPDKETITLNVNHRVGGEVLLEIRNAPHESAVKLAHLLHFKGDKDALLWSGPYYNILSLSHDGSAEAEMLRMEMLRLNVVFVLVKQASELELSDGRYRYTREYNGVDAMLRVIRETNEWERKKKVRTR